MSNRINVEPIYSSSHAKHEMGQVLLEFVLCSMIVGSFVTVAFLLLKDYWRISQCSYFVFEAVHKKRIGEKFISPVYVNVEETPEGFEGVGRCGTHVEKVKLPKLESHGLIPTFAK